LGSKCTTPSPTRRSSSPVLAPYLQPEGHNDQKGSSKAQARLFNIGPDDYLLQVAGCFDGHLLKLELLTYRGIVGVFGDATRPNRFVFRFEGYTFGSFSSGFKSYVEFLEIKLRILPQEFFSKFLPTPTMNSLKLDQKSVD